MKSRNLFILFYSSVFDDIDNKNHNLFLALVHDLAECIVGDITPYCGVSKEEKKEREMNAMRDIVKLIEPRGERLMELFEVCLSSNSD